MANAKISELTELTSVAVGDLLAIVDISDTTQASTGTTKKITQANLGYAPTASPTFTGTVILPSTTSIGTVSNTEISYLDGVTSAIQTQIDTKAPTASPTFTGAVTLAENASIALDPAGSADGKYTGITIAGTAGTTLAFGDLCYLAVADSRWELTDADASATGGPVLIGMCVLAAASDGSPTTLLLQGQIRADAKFPALTVGATVYLGETAGAIQVAIPTGADNVIRVVGFALTADEIYFNPSQDHQLTVA